MQYVDADAISALNDLDWEPTQNGITIFTSAVEIDVFLQAMFDFGVDSRPMAIPSGFAVEIDKIYLSRLAELRLWNSGGGDPKGSHGDQTKYKPLWLGRFNQ